MTDAISVINLSLEAIVEFRDNGLTLRYACLHMAPVDATRAWIDGLCGAQTKDRSLN